MLFVSGSASDSAIESVSVFAFASGWMTASHWAFASDWMIASVCLTAFGSVTAFGWQLLFDLMTVSVKRIAFDSLIVFEFAFGWTFESN